MTEKIPKWPAQLMPAFHLYVAAVEHEELCSGFTKPEPCS